MRTSIYGLTAAMALIALPATVQASADDADLPSVRDLGDRLYATAA